MVILDRRVERSAFLVSLGGFVFGYDCGALAASTQSLREYFHLSMFAYGFTISASVWGTVAGSLIASPLADRLGRRALISGCTVLFASACLAVLLPLHWAWNAVLVFRFLCGMSIGGLTVGCPLYIAELAPPEVRGRLVSYFQVQVGTGVVVAFATGWILTHLVAHGSLWAWCLGLGVWPAMLLFGILRSGMIKDRSELPAQKMTEQERLFTRKHLRPILLATSVALFNQLSGVNVIMFYVLDILVRDRGFIVGHRYTVAISVIGLFTTLAGMSFVDRLGRRPLLILGAAGMAICLLALGIAVPQHLAPFCYLAIIVTYNALFAFSQGTIVWVYLSEIFPVGVRGAGQGYGSAVHWIANAILISLFPLLQHASSERAFYFFALMMLLQIGVVWLYYPETRGVSLGDLSRMEDSGALVAKRWMLDWSRYGHSKESGADVGGCRPGSGRIS